MAGITPRERNGIIAVAAIAVLISSIGWWFRNRSVVNDFPSALSQDSISVVAGREIDSTDYRHKGKAGKQKRNRKKGSKGSKVRKKESRSVQSATIRRIELDNIETGYGTSNDTIEQKNI